MKANYSNIRLLLSVVLFMQSFLIFSQSSQYLHFDEEDDYALLAQGGQYVTGTDEMSITGWFFCDELGYGQGYMGFRGTGTGTGEFYLIQVDNGTMECRLRSTTGLHEYVSPVNTAVDSVWQHIAWVYDGSLVLLYVDGNLIGSGSASGIFSSSTVDFAIGKSTLPGFDFVFGGRVDEVSVWNKGLTQAEVQDIITNELTGTEDSLKMYYKFNQGVPGGDNTAITHLTCEIGTGERDAELFNFALTGDSSNFNADELYANFSASDTISCLNETVSFADNSAGNVSSWNWTFEGGTPGSSTEQNPDVIYESLGIFDVELIVSDGDDYDTLIKENYIEVLTTPGTADTPVGPDATCEGGTYDYTTSVVSDADAYEWDVTPSDAGTITGGGTTGTFYAATEWSGPYSIKVRATNICGFGAWSPELSADLYATPEPFFLGGGGSYCEGGDGLEITLDDSETGVNYELFLDGVSTGTIVAGTGSPISFGLQTEEGTYTANGIAGNCLNDMNGQPFISVDIAPGPAGQPEGPQEVCNDEISEYTTTGAPDADMLVWSIDPSNAGLLTPGDLMVEVAWDDTFIGTATLSVLGNNDCGDGEPADLEITVYNAPAPEISGLTLVCDNDFADYSTPENAGSTYEWEVSGGNIVSGAGTYMIQVEWGAPGTGFVSVTEDNVSCEPATTEPYEVTIDDCTGIDEDETSAISVYPNPVKDILHIEMGSEIKGKINVSVHNMLGKEVVRKEGIVLKDNRAITLDFGGLNQGTYIVEIAAENGLNTIKIEKGD